MEHRSSNALVAVHSFRLWKLKELAPTRAAVLVERCSSLVPIVETERLYSRNADTKCPYVAVHSFRLWKLKGQSRDARRLLHDSCSSLVPIVETERHYGRQGVVQLQEVAVHSFRLWKLKGSPTRFGCWHGSLLQFTRSDCGN
mgnify:CR=1 FL=1